MYPQNIWINLVLNVFLFASIPFSRFTRLNQDAPLLEIYIFKRKIKETKNKRQWRWIHISVVSTQIS